MVIYISIIDNCPDYKTMIRIVIIRVLKVIHMYRYNKQLEGDYSYHIIFIIPFFGFTRSN